MSLGECIINLYGKQVFIYYLDVEMFVFEVIDDGGKCG